MLLCHVLFSMDFIQLISLGYYPYEAVLYICQFTSEESETQIHEFTFPESYNLGMGQDLNSSHPTPEPVPNPYVSAKWGNALRGT